MTKKQQQGVLSPLKIGMIFGLLLLFCATLLWFAAEEDRLPPDTGEDEKKISVEAFLGGYQAILEELNAPEVIVPVEVSPALTFSLDEEPSAYFSEDCTLEITADRSGSIYYTTNGETPTAEAGTLYEGPLKLTPGDPLTAYHYAVAVLYEDGTYSDVYYRTYFVGSEIAKQLGLLVFSVDAEENDLWSAEQGIFHQNNLNRRGKSWERPMNVQLFDVDGSEVFNMPAGIRLYGAYSRTMIQKPMRFRARPEYDEILDDFNTLDMFGIMYDAQGVRIDRFEDLILRNAGNDFGQAFMRDELVHTLMTQQGFGITEPVRPCLIYINGTLYGLYWLHEPYKENYFENRYSYLNYQGEFVVLDGGERNKQPDGKEHDGFDPLADYNEMIAYGNLDLTDDDTYAELCARLDVDSYLRLNASMVYVDNGDWPQNNNRVLKYFAKEGEDFSDVYGMDGKWYFVPHDTDWAFPSNGANRNVLLRYYDPTERQHNQYSPLFVNLMQREDCQKTYVTYFLDMMNDAFSPENMSATIQEIADTIYPGLELYVALSPYQANNFDMAAFERRYGRIITYAQERAGYLVQHLEEVYGLGTPYTLNVKVPDGAGVQVNTIKREGDFVGTYYSDYATTLKPIVPLGYVFDHWTVNGEVHADPLLFVRATHAIDGEVEVKLFLKEDGKLRIKEISFVNGGDYIVLYNPGSAPVSTRGYSLSDDGNNLRKFTLPMMVVGAGEELVVYCDNYNTLEALRHQQTSFNLSKTETLYLTRSNDDATVRTVIDQIYLPDVHRGSIYVRQEYDKRFYEVLAEDLEQQ